MKHSFKDLLAERTDYQFLSRVWRWAAVSGVLLMIGLVGFVVKGGFNFGLDFTGGVAFDVTAKSEPKVEEVRKIMSEAGAEDAKITLIGETGIRAQTKYLAEKGDEVRRVALREELGTYAGVSGDEVSTSTVSGTWGDTITQSAIKALFGFFIVVLIYLTIRLEFKMGIAALVAVAHDIVLTAVIYALFGLEIAPATVVALLTILGFSLYDTVIVFDKIEENAQQLAVKKSLTYRTVANNSLNQVLLRSINTSVVALMPVAALVFIGWLMLGADTIGQFALALLCGLATGTYSSIFVATPVLVWLKEREPQLKRRAERALATP